MLLAKSTDVVYTAAGLLAVLVLYALHTIYSNPLRHIPGPWHTLLTRFPLKRSILKGRRMYYVHDLHSCYGPVVRISPYEVAVADPEGFGAIHRIGGGFLKSPWYENSNMPDGGEPSIFAMRDPKKHAIRRRLLAKVFTKASLRRNWEGVVRANVEKAVEKIYNEAKEAQCSDVLKWFTMMTTDVVAQLCFGESFKMLELGEKNDYMKMLELISIQNTMQYEIPWLQFIRARFSVLKSSTDTIDAQAVLKRYGDRALSNLRQNSDHCQTLFTNMLSAVDTDMKCCNDEESEDKITEEMVHIESRSMIIGGSDTTSITLTYLVWAVLKRPDLRVGLEEEVSGLEPSFNDAALEKLPLLNAVIDETLRLYGAVSGQLSRTVPANGATLGGYFVPGGITVETQAYTLHRDPDAWPDPLRFDETRFLDPSKLTQKQKLLFSPWGAGSRICLGVELAKMELRLGVAVLFRKCSGLRLAPGMTDRMMQMENYFLVSPVGHKCEVTLS
ncbi:cytochrome P450 [Colletotrichum tofieldiae]|uniref:Cytochrome P450 (TRI11) n=1 Tax=Colletotrichum tofieldiae TaxID=708197 RepID=A0A166UZK3_9PEZI|nr:cytochrome P450 (TRI11) [Colletotrichum tofieldiae]GKT61678.1 cytochrome P450 [Colletotrichum tofieldiae]GKT70268.1 cytochrome P450 [Colletotrichum tofieldiae]GKT93322.1 cytochrome P450 [Colletotrichum tofieldiae]